MTLIPRSHAWLGGKDADFVPVDGSRIRRENQLRLVVYPIIYKVLYIPGGDRRISEPSTVGLDHTMTFP